MEDDNISKYNDNKSVRNEKIYNQTESFSNKKSKLLKLNTIRSMSVRRDSNKTIKKENVEEYYYIYDKQIFEKIYSQIHQNIKDFDEEIESGKKLLNSSKKPEKPLFHYNFKTGNFLLDNCKNDNFSKKISNISNNSKSYFLKTFSGNINKLYGERTIKRVMFKNPHLNGIINNKKANDNRLSIKSYTDRNKKNEFKFSIPILKKTSNIIARNQTSRLILKNSSSLISNTQFNKTLTSISTENKEENNYREKTYYVEYDPRWYFKNKLIKTRLEKATISSPIFQQKFIDDELVLLFDNMKYFQSKYLVNDNLYHDFCKLSHSSQINLNTLLEEAIGLFTEISYLFVGNYSENINKYILNPLPRYNKKETKKVENEQKEFKININTFYESYIFIKECYETYKIILNTKKDFFMKLHTFEILFQFLDRARFTVSKICAELNNIYHEPNEIDKRLIARCMNRIKNNHLKIINNLKIDNKKDDNSLIYTSKSFSRARFLKKFNNEYKSKIDCHKKFGIFKNGIDSFSYKGPKKLKLSEPILMNMRINKAFNDKSRNLKLKRVVKFDINSPLVNSLMKYATNKFKSDIISERIRQRFYNDKDNNEKN